MIFRCALILLAIVCCTTAVPPCICPDVLDPVCGSDNQTYENQCILECESRTNRGLSLLRKGSCDKALCICGYSYKPVCGSDGRTYPNKCTFDCEKTAEAKNHPDLKIEHDGTC